MVSLSLSLSQEKMYFIYNMWIHTVLNKKQASRSNNLFPVEGTLPLLGEEAGLFSFSWVAQRLVAQVGGKPVEPPQLRAVTSLQLSLMKTRAPSPLAHQWDPTVCSCHQPRLPLSWHS